jgi:hypothetical protein
VNLLELQADQLYTWSDHYAPHIAQTDFVRFAKASAAAVTPVAATRSSAARFTHRALQAVWQAGMQMRPRSRSWPQVLPLRELYRPKAANGLRAPGASRPDHRVSSPSPSGSAKSWRRSARSIANCYDGARQSERWPCTIPRLRSPFRGTRKWEAGCWPICWQIG